MNKKLAVTAICCILLSVVVLAYLIYAAVLFLGAGYSWLDITFDATHLHWVVKETYVPRLIMCCLLAVLMGTCWFLNRKERQARSLAIYSLAGVISAIITVIQICA